MACSSSSTTIASASTVAGDMLDGSLLAHARTVRILLGHDFWIFHVQKLPRYGFWSMAHEARADLCMLLGAMLALRLRRRSGPK
jgi:hypothetical protein